MPNNDLKFKFHVRFTCVIYRNRERGDGYRLRRRFIVWAANGQAAIDEAHRLVRRRPRLRNAYEPRYEVIKVFERGE